MDILQRVLQASLNTVSWRYNMFILKDLPSYYVCPAGFNDNEGLSVSIIMFPNNFRVARTQFWSSGVEDRRIPKGSSSTILIKYTPQGKIRLI